MNITSTQDSDLGRFVLVTVDSLRVGDQVAPNGLDDDLIVAIKQDRRMQWRLSLAEGGTFTVASGAYLIRKYVSGE